MSVLDEPLQVAVTATSYPRHTGDWQSVFIERQLAALARRPELQVRFWGPDGPRPQAVQLAASAPDLELLRSITEAGGIAHLLRRHKLRGAASGLRLIRRLGAALRRMEPSTQVFHLNWLQSALALPGTHTPALVTVLGTDFRLLGLPLVPTLLRHAFRGRRILLAPNAAWMVSGLQQAFGECCAEIREIPFGIDPRWYAIRRQPAERPRWITVLRLTKAKIGPYFEWTRGAAERGHEFHLFGPMQEQLTVPDWIHYHGAIDQNSLAGHWYPQSTGMITLSQHDEGRPQVLLEAMAAGLPIIASAIAAHRDLFASEGTARLVCSFRDFMTAIQELAEVEVGARLGARARSHARHTYGTWDDCAQRYIQGYRQLLATGA